MVETPTRFAIEEWALGLPMAVFFRVRPVDWMKRPKVEDQD